LHRAGYASQPHSVARGDGLRLKDAWVTAAVRCAPPANRPTPAEQTECRAWLVEELGLLPRCRVIVALGGLAWTAARRATGARGRSPPFGPGVVRPLPGGRVLVGSYHPSQQNTFTGRLTAAMMDALLRTVRELAESGPVGVSPPRPRRGRR